MKKSTALSALALGILLSSSAHAVVSVNLVLESPAIFPGAIITLHTVVTANGGETDFGVLGLIEYDDALVDAIPASNSQVNLSTIGDANPGWSNGGLFCTPEFCVAFNQTRTLPAVTAGLTNVVIATTNFLVHSDVVFPTLFSFRWRTSPSTQRLDFFGVTNAPGVTSTIIPEPVTAALLAVGLLALAAARRQCRRAVSLIALAVAVAGFAPSADAAVSVTLSASGVFAPGSLITLTTTVTSDGGETDLGVIGNILIPAGGFVIPNLGLNTQVNLSTVGDSTPGWGNGGLICTPQFCTAFNQTNAIGPSTAGVTNLAIAQTHFTINPTTPSGSVIHFSWRTTPSTQRLNWFGVTNAPGACVVVAENQAPCIIPEPTTAALLGVGLLGLALARRRAS